MGGKEWRGEFFCKARRPRGSTLLRKMTATSTTDLIARFRLSIPRATPRVGRFLRKRHVCGAGPLGDRSLPRRSSGESLPGRSLGQRRPGRSSGEPGLFRGLGILRNASEVGRFLRKRHVCGAGPLGDRSLPRRSSGESRPGRCLGQSRPRRSSGESRGCTAGLAFSGTLPR